MPQHPAAREAVHDETVRMRADGPAPDGGPQLPVERGRRHPARDARLAPRARPTPTR